MLLQDESRGELEKVRSLARSFVCHHHYNYHGIEDECQRDGIPCFFSFVLLFLVIVATTTTTRRRRTTPNIEQTIELVLRKEKKRKEISFDLFLLPSVRTCVRTCTRASHDAKLGSKMDAEEG